MMSVMSTLASESFTVLVHILVELLTQECRKPTKLEADPVGLKTAHPLYIFVRHVGITWFLPLPFVKSFQTDAITNILDE